MAELAQNPLPISRRISDVGELLSAIDEGLAVRARDIDEGSRFLGSLLFVPDEIFLTQARSLDPYSDEYADLHVKLYEEIAGRAYTPEDEGQETPSDGLVSPPFHLHPEQAGYWTSVYGHILSTLKLKRGARVLEVGYGAGGLTELLVRAGLDVTAVELRPSNARFLERRLSPLGLTATTITGSIDDAELNGPYDRIIFFESFHHIPNFVQTLERLTDQLADDGALVFAAEPIVDDDDPVVPFPWGLRLDGGALAAARDVGWREVGFQRGFFVDMLRRIGFLADNHDLPGFAHGRVIVAVRDRPEVSASPPQVEGEHTHSLTIARRLHSIPLDAFGRPGRRAYWCEWNHEYELERSFLHFTGGYRDYYRWSRLIKPGDVCVDVGAHSGDTAIPMGIFCNSEDRSGVVVAIEPNPELFPLLALNLELNANVACFRHIRAAVTAENMELVEISDHGSALCNAGILHDKLNPELRQSLASRPHRTFTAPGYTLETICNNLLSDPEVARINFIKTDCEGYDEEILRTSMSFLRKWKPFVFVEWYDYYTPEDSRRFFKVIEQLGFHPLHPSTWQPMSPSDASPGDLLLVHPDRMEELASL